MAEKKGTVTSRVALLTGAGLAVVVIAVAIYTHRIPRSTDPVSSLSDEQRAYLGQIEISDSRMSAAENFLGHTVTYLDAMIANRGTRAVSQVQLEMEFVDMLGQVVLREAAGPVSRQTPALKPGQSRPFQVTFEHMPIEWNQAPPKIRVKLVTFE